MTDQLTDIDKAILQKYGVAPSAQESKDNSLSDTDREILSKYGIPVRDAAAAPKKDDSLKGFIGAASPKDDLKSERAQFNLPPLSPKPTAWNTFLGARRNQYEEPTPGKALNYLGGMLDTGALEALKRIATGGTEGAGQQRWDQARSGEASVPDMLKKEGHVSPLVAWPAGLVMQASTDPFAGAMSMSNTELPQGETLLQDLFPQLPPGTPPPGAGNILKQVSPDDAQDMRSIGGAIDATGKKMYSAPFKRGDVAVRGKYKDSANRGDTELSDLLWNNGDPLAGGYGKSPMDIAYEVEALRKQAGRKIGQNVQGDDTLYDLAPNLESTMREQYGRSLLDDLANSEKGANVTGTQGPFTSPKDGLDWLKEKLSSQDPQERAQAIQHLSMVRNATQAFDPWSQLKGMLRSKKTRGDAIDILSEHVPAFSNVIQNNARHLRNADDAPAILNFYDSLIDNLAEGPRTLDELHGLKVSLGNKAQGSTASQSNQFAHGAKPSTARTADMSAAQELSDVIDGFVDDKIGSAQNQADKATASTLYRGTYPVRQAMTNLANRKKFTIFDALGAGGLGAAGAAFAHDPILALKMLASGGVAKGAYEFKNSPGMMTGTGAKLGALGKSNLWDNMLRKGAQLEGDK